MDGRSLHRRFPPPRTLDVTGHFVQRFRERVNNQATLEEMLASLRTIRPVSELEAWFEYDVVGRNKLEGPEVGIMCKPRDYNVVFLIRPMGNQGHYRAITVLPRTVGQ